MRAVTLSGGQTVTGGCGQYAAVDLPIQKALPFALISPKWMGLAERRAIKLKGVGVAVAVGEVDEDALSVDVAIQLQALEIRLALHSEGI